MLKALDKNDETIYIDDATKGVIYRCQICKQPVFQKRGLIKRHHFSHYSPTGHHGNYVPCPDKWKYDEKTDWHIEWQEAFGKSNMEKVIELSKDKHIADVLIDNIIVEFQHSNMSIETFRERNEFYTNAGYKVIWIFDMIDQYQSGNITRDEEINNCFYWTNPNKLFKNIDLYNEKVTIYFQFSNDKETKCIEKIIKTYNESRIFYTKKIDALTFFDFIKKVKSKDERLFLEEPTPYYIDGGKSIYELWMPNYIRMVIKNLHTGDIRLVKGKDGVIVRSGRFNTISSRYYKSDEIEQKYISISSEAYAISDEDKRIWSLLKAYIDTEYEAKKEKELEEQRKTEERNHLIKEKQDAIFSEKQKYKDNYPDSIIKGLSLSDLIDSSSIKDLYVKNMHDNTIYLLSFNKGVRRIRFCESYLIDDNTGETIEFDKEKLDLLKDKKIWERTSASELGIKK